jgi:predicted RNA-binding Zn-ribbon protein involved in translation (DUF1610 family)
MNKCCKNPRENSKNKLSKERIYAEAIEFHKIIKAEDEAFEKAGIDEGTVTYICPICGGEAVANRYKFGDRYHGLGSGCRTCGTWHS